MIHILHPKKTFTLRLIQKQTKEGQPKQIASQDVTFTDSEGHHFKGEKFQAIMSMAASDFLHSIMAVDVQEKQQEKQ